MYRRDGERFIGSISATLLRGADGEPRAWIGLLRDITARKQAEAALARAMEEKTALLREMQHRVMNGLTLITSLIRLEESQASATETRSVLLDLQNRVASLAGLYSILYQTGKVYDVRLDEYLRRIVQNLAQSYIYVDRAGEAPIQIEQHYDAITVEARNATALGLILNELMTNTMKYAFPGGKSGTVWIELKKSEAGIALCVSHNGAGLPPGFDRNQSSGFGMQLVSLLAEQIGGKFTFEQAAPGGADQEHPATVFCVQAPPDIISLQDL